MHFLCIFQIRQSKTTISAENRESFVVFCAPYSFDSCSPRGRERPAFIHGCSPDPFCNVIKPRNVYSIGFASENPRNLSSKQEVVLLTSYKVICYDQFHMCSFFFSFSLSVWVHNNWRTLEIFNSETIFCLRLYFLTGVFLYQ